MFDILLLIKITQNTIMAATTSLLIFVTSQQLTNLLSQESFSEKTGLLQNHEIQGMINSLLVGAISVSGTCNHVNVLASSVIGGIAAIIYISTRKVLQRFEIDDPLEVTQVHGVAGLWGLTAIGVFDTDMGLITTGNLNFFGT